MEECKVMQAQAKRMKTAHESACSRYRPRGKGNKKRGSSSDEEVNALVKLAVKAALKRKKKAPEGNKDEEDDFYNLRIWRSTEAAERTLTECRVY